MKRIDCDMREYILERSIPVTESGCWIWELCESRGYGSVHLKRVTHLAHRISYEAFKGPIGGMHVCHKCDTPQCVNPDHLFLGTNQGNILDSVAKGRRLGIPRNRPFGLDYKYDGEQLNSRRKIRHSDRKRIVERLMAGERGSDLAREYGVTPTLICIYKKAARAA